MCGTCGKCTKNPADFSVHIAANLVDVVFEWSFVVCLNSRIFQDFLSLNDIFLFRSKIGKVVFQTFILPMFEDFKFCWIEFHIVSSAPIIDIVDFILEVFNVLLTVNMPGYAPWTCACEKYLWLKILACVKMLTFSISVWLPDNITKHCNGCFVRIW